MRRDRARELDVFGRALWDWAQGGITPEVLERDDGFTQIGAGPEVYLSGFREWPAAERKSLQALRGRVLDIGCGAGRVALELQRRGIDVVGLDSSPLAVKAAKVRGVRHVWCLSIEELGSRIGSFDSLVLFGNNFGIFETPPRAREILSTLATTTKPSARIFVESTNAYGGSAPGFDRSHYRRNLELGITPGQSRLRFRYEELVGPWFNWLYVSRSEMKVILRGTGWHVREFIGVSPVDPYVAVLEKD
jgi:SAM-dependent methyltransferase